MNRHGKLTRYATLFVAALLAVLAITGTGHAAEFDERAEQVPVAATSVADAAMGGCEDVAAAVTSDVHSAASPFAAATSAPSLTEQSAPSSDCFILLVCAYELWEGVWVYVCRVRATNCPSS